jgi:uncharacterized protein involved in exopolysaccharide biosynthesis
MTENSDDVERMREKLDEVERDIQDVKRQLAEDDPAHFGHERHFADSGETEEEDDQTIAPPG